jgi:hypothetical protein
MSIPAASGVVQVTEVLDKMLEKTAYAGWANCIRLSNGECELIATTDVGPRIIRFGFTGGNNLLKEIKSQLGRTLGEDWLPYGGHRLWHAPEVAPRTYAPDNDPVDYREEGDTLHLIQQTEHTTGIRKEMRITLHGERNEARVVHVLTNRNVWEVELAPWALTVMAPEGTAILPQEDYRPHPDYLLPARPLVLWHYTNMADPRFTWGEKFIRVRQVLGSKNKQKIGMRNTKGWMAYALEEDLFIKRCGFDPAATYPDFGCNTEVYTDNSILELESLGPLTRIPPGGSVQLEEVWSLHKADVGETDHEIEEKLLPLVPEL